MNEKCSSDQLGAGVELRFVVGDWPLMGRSEELKIIGEATRRAGGPRGIALSGAAGVGKTRLARAAVAACGPAGARRHWVVGTLSGSDVPLGVFAEVASDFGPDPLRRVREVIDALVGDPPVDRVIIGVDDAHLLDDLSAFVVHQLVTRRLATVIVTVRSGMSASDTISSLWKDEHLERLEVQPLSLDEVTDLLEEVLGGQIETFTAHRLWAFTHGNALYLRHLVDGEVESGRLSRSAGMWLWKGEPSLSPTLADLIAARIGNVPAAIGEVLDTLAVCEPLDLIALTDVTDSKTVIAAESMGLVTVDTAVRPPTVRFAHPLFGEARRARIGSLKLRELRGRVATALGANLGGDARRQVQRAVLALDSNLPEDPKLLLEAARAAAHLMDLRLAEILAGRAATAGGGVPAKVFQAFTIAAQLRGKHTEDILRALDSTTVGAERANVAELRALNFVLNLGEASKAQEALDVAPAVDAPTHRAHSALRAYIDLARGNAASAVGTAVRLLQTRTVDDDRMVLISTWSAVGGLGDLGRIAEIATLADEGYKVAATSAEASYMGFGVAIYQIHAYWLAGALDQAEAVVDRIRRDAADIPYAHSLVAYLRGQAAMARGSLHDARRWFQEAIAFARVTNPRGYTATVGSVWLATVLAKAGEVSQAADELESVRWSKDTQHVFWDSSIALAHAWLRAAEGAVTEAIEIARIAAEQSARLGRPAVEAMCLQTATQFGDLTTGSRLSALCDTVEGARAPAAAAHASALADGDGDGLVGAAARYQSFGDRIAAADAAAQAASAYQHAGRRGAALTARENAHRIAVECGAATPALRVMSAASPFTDRQREVISLASQGLSNRAIADRLNMSVRSVEGHLFRASQRAGVNSRAELIAILQKT